MSRKMALKKYKRRFVWRLTAAYWLLTRSEVTFSIVGKEITFFIRNKKCPLWKIWDLKNKPDDQDVADLSALQALASSNTGITFFDIGAYIGLYSLYTSSLNCNNRIYAFEPDMKIREILNKNIELNGSSNIYATDCAISDKDGTVKFLATSDSKSHITEINQQNEEAGCVTSIRLDSFVKKIQKVPNIIKIDVEGYEVEVFNGGLETLGNPSVWIFIEIHAKELKQRGLLDVFTNKILKLNKKITTPDGKIAQSSDLKNGGHFIIHGTPNIQKSPSNAVELNTIGLTS